MAEQEVWVGSSGPYLYEDTDTYDPDDPGSEYIHGIMADKIFLTGTPTDENEAARIKDIGSYSTNNGNSDFIITEYGGFALKLIAGEDLFEGEVVYIPQAGSDGEVLKNPVDGDMPVGVVYLDAEEDEPVYVVVAGKAYVLPETAVTAAIGYLLHSSNAEAGRVDQVSAVPADNLHFRQVGYALETGTGAGVKFLAIIHVN